MPIRCVDISLCVQQPRHDVAMPCAGGEQKSSRVIGIPHIGTHPRFQQ